MIETSLIEKEVLQRNTHRNDILKLLAFVTMLIDHIGYMYFPDEVIFRIIGRLAFPIFAYQIALGYSKTSNLKKYVFRLSLFALITQIPYSFFNPDLKFNPVHFNVLFTFITAIGLLYVYDMGILRIKNFIEDRNYKHLLYGIFLLILAVAIIILPEVISFIVKGFSLEYGLLALTLVLLFHIFKENYKALIMGILLLYSFHVYYRVALFNSQYSLTILWNNFFNIKFALSQLSFQNGFSQIQKYYFNAWGALALIPILSFERINSSRVRLNKYIGYVFYPAHMTILVIITFILRTY